MKEIFLCFPTDGKEPCPERSRRDGWGKILRTSVCSSICGKIWFLLWLCGIMVLPGACARMPIPTMTPQTAPSLPPPTPLPTMYQTPAPTLTTTKTVAPITAPTVAPIGAPTAPRTIAPISTQMPATATFAYERNSRAVLIEADESGGLAPVPRDAHVPKFRLYADGFVVFAGESAPLSTGLDAVVRTGRLTDAQIQELLTYLNQVGFFALKDYYEPRPKPTDMPTAHISVYLNKVKTVSVYAPGFAGTPQVFSDAFTRITQTLPADAQTYMPIDGYLRATSAGSISSLGANVRLPEWSSNTGVRLADASSGVLVSGNTYTRITALIAQTFPDTLYREGDRAYRVRFTPNLPRAVYLTDWIGAILEAPREFDGRTFEIVGYFRGWNLYGEASGNPPVTRSDWVIADESGAIYVTGALPRGLDASSRADAWTVVRLQAVVVYVRLGTSHLEARRIEIFTSKNGLPSTPMVVATTTRAATRVTTPQPTPTRTITPILTPIAGVDIAIAAVKARFPEVANIYVTGTGTIGATTDIKVIMPRQDAWYLIFWEGWGDCVAGCINNRYSYFVVESSGRVSKAGEYARVFNADKNAFETTGTPLWGVPK